MDVINLPTPKYKAKVALGLSSVLVYNPIALGIRWKASPKPRIIQAIAKYIFFFLIRR